MYAPDDNTAPKGLRGVVGSSPAIRHATHDLARGEDVALFRHRRHPRCRVPGLGGMHFGTV